MALGPWGPWGPVKTEHMIELEAGKNLMSTIVNIGLLPTAQMEVGALRWPFPPFALGVLLRLVHHHKGVRQAVAKWSTKDETFPSDSVGGDGRGNRL